ncbi:MAG: ATPase, T2SS/T4P/T4SS family [Phycisphaerales bacterium]
MSEPHGPEATAPGTAGTPTEPSGGRKLMRVGEILVQEGVVTPEQVSKALAAQKGAGMMLGEVLVEQGAITNATLVRALARSLGVRGVQIRHGLVDPALLAELGEEEAERLKALPLFRVHGEMTVAMAEPQSLPTIDRLRSLTGCKIRPVLALKANIHEFIKKYAGGNVDVDAFLTSLAESDVEVIERESVDDEPTTDLDQMVAGSPIVNLVNVALLTAVKDGASDIHLEPNKKGTRIRYRIDGALRDLMKPPPGMHSAIVSRIKIIGKMDIAEKRLPQEGRVRIVAEGREIDLRVSSIPTLLGEKLVIRILDKANLRVKMEDLGFRTESLETFQRILKRPYGLVLVTGPTGSGKTTTLYSALDLLRSPELNIVTVEDPVEYQLDLVNQIQVNEQIGLGFARTLRSILRQDPDVVMIGEIRDEETAHVAVQAALTGHVVLATLHTNDSPGAVERLRDMHVESYLISAALNGAVAQRLARSVCPACATKYHPSAEVLEDAGLSHMGSRAFRKGGGCQTCHDTGFQGRFAIYEVMEVDSDIRRMIYAGRASHEIRAELQKKGVRSLREEGVSYALEGRTSLEEVLRVTHIDDSSDGTASEQALRLEERAAA